MGFQWDPAKSAANEVKHGLPFADAVAIFAEPVLVVEYTRHRYGEPRWKHSANLKGSFSTSPIPNVTAT